MSDRPPDPGFCTVALPRPLRQTFVYRIPGRLAGSVEPGARVLVPFRRRKMVGCVDRLQKETDLDRVREVLDVLDPDPMVPPSLLALCRWTAEYYVAPPGLVLRAALPPGSFAESSYRVRLTDRESAGDELDGPARAVLERLARATDGLQAKTLREDAGLRSVWPVLRDLRRRGLVRISEELPGGGSRVKRQQVVRLSRELPTLLSREETFGRAHRQQQAYEALEDLGGRALVTHMTKRLGFSRSVLKGLEERDVAVIEEEALERDPFAEVEPEPRPPLEPTPAQSAVVEGLLEQAASEDPGIGLLRGVTGSGKTLVYLHVLEELVGRQGGSAIVLVPEISLTPQTVQRFRAVFGDEVAVLHSGLSAGERHDAWRALREGRKRLAVGARSAIFAPVRDLRAIVVDEEHESSYKQSDTPRYHARALATVRSRMEGALCVLGSATPSLESWHHAVEGRYTLYELPERVTAQPLPDVKLVDLREEREARRSRSIDRAGEGGERPDAGPLVFSRPLEEALEEVLERGEQALLLLNRRGYSAFVQCRECGKVWNCRRCNVSLTFHRRLDRILCHHCGFQARVPDACDECGADGLTFSGVGTQQVERRLGELFPSARLARMDVDTTGSKWAHFEILESVRRGEVDVLLGTQMIAKGLDFPNVTLVGVVNADVGLNLPDFRASERTFQLLSQVAGRAGRGERPGRVLVQTARPRHFALQRAVEHDYRGFAEQELVDREGPGYPPHRRLANLVVSGDDREDVAGTADEIASWTREAVREGGLEGVDVVGPAPCPIDRLRERWRWHFFVKSDDAATLGPLLRVLSERRGQPSGDLWLEIDRDPESLL